MSTLQQVITIAILASVMFMTRALPFLIFSRDKKTPKYIQYLGSVLPLAVFGMLVVYCLKGGDSFYDFNSCMAPSIVLVNCHGHHCLYDFNPRYSSLMLMSTCISSSLISKSIAAFCLMYSS